MPPNLESESLFWWFLRCPRGKQQLVKAHSDAEILVLDAGLRGLKRLENTPPPPIKRVYMAYKSGFYDGDLQGSALACSKGPRSFCMCVGCQRLQH